MFTFFKEQRAYIQKTARLVDKSGGSNTPRGAWDINLPVFDINLAVFCMYGHYLNKVYKDIKIVLLSL